MSRNPPDLKRLVLVLVGDHLPHHLQHCHLLFTNPGEEKSGWLVGFKTCPSYLHLTIHRLGSLTSGSKVCWVISSLISSPPSPKRWIAAVSSLYLSKRVWQTCWYYQKKAIPIPVVLLDLLFIHLIHLEATLPITLSHVSLHIGSGLASFICFVGIEGVSVAIVPPRILVLLIVGVNLGLVDNEIPRISSPSLFLEFSIILKNRIGLESLILKLIPLHRSHLPHLGLRPRALVHQRHPPPPPKDEGSTSSREKKNNLHKKIFNSATSSASSLLIFFLPP